MDFSMLSSPNINWINGNEVISWAKSNWHVSCSQTEWAVCNVVYWQWGQVTSNTLTSEKWHIAPWVPWANSSDPASSLFSSSSLSQSAMSSATYCRYFLSQTSTSFNFQSQQIPPLHCDTAWSSYLNLTSVWTAASQDSLRCRSGPIGLWQKM